MKLAYSGPLVMQNIRATASSCLLRAQFGPPRAYLSYAEQMTNQHHLAHTAAQCQTVRWLHILRWSEVLGQPNWLPNLQNGSCSSPDGGKNKATLMLLGVRLVT